MDGFSARVSEAMTGESLLRCHQDLLRCLEEQERPGTIGETMRNISRRHDAIVARALELAVHELDRQGLGRPGASFCWLALGSGARAEQTQWTDQDNALVYESEAPEDAEYFCRLSSLTVRILAEAGYPLCPGYVMAENPRWRGSVEQWQTRLRTYAELPNWDNVRFLMIAADMRALYGDASLAETIHTELVEMIRRSPFIQWQVASHEDQHRVVVKRFDSLPLEIEGEHKGQFNVKEGIYVPLVNCLRLWALSHGITAVSSMERLRELERRNVWDREFTRQLQSALDTVLELRLSFASGHYIHPQTIGVSRSMALIQAMKTVRNFQSRTARHFRKPG